MIGWGGGLVRHLYENKCVCVEGGWLVGVVGWVGYLDGNPYIINKFSNPQYASAQPHNQQASQSNGRHVVAVGVRITLTHRHRHLYIYIHI